MSPARFYVTTPLYYVNDEPHIGHAYTTVLADVLARFHRLRGDSTWFLTGLDEHGQKIQDAAGKRGLDPQTHCDQMAERFLDIWAKLDISYDDFIRTTEPRHKAVVTRVLSDLYARGEIYADTYEGLYCIPDERFWTEKDLVDGKCPLCGRAVVPLSERNYFFRMSSYQEWLIREVEENSEFVLPDFRRNEVLGFLRKPLGDLCISRPAKRLGWGIPLPFDPEYVTYVWFDALINYYSAVHDARAADGSPWWPADVHLIGKDILTTHAVYWPTMLKAAGLARPRTILAHGWWLQGDAKMAKSVGNVIRPLDMAGRYGVDAFRYFLMRDMVIGQDSNFSEAAFVGRINSDLANDLGNCLNRIERMIHTHWDDRVPPSGEPGEAEGPLIELARRTVERVIRGFEEIRIHQAIEDALELVRDVNRYLEVKSPWKAVKTEGREGIATTLAVSAEAIRLAAALLSPVMPRKAGEALYRLGVLDAPDALVARAAGTRAALEHDARGAGEHDARGAGEHDARAGDPSWLAWGLSRPDTRIRPGAPLFPRIETSATE